MEAMQKTITVHHNESSDMLRLGCKLPIFANICPHKSNVAKLYQFTEGDKDLREIIRNDMVGGPSKVSTHKAVVIESLVCKSSNNCNSIVGIDTSKTYRFSICQSMPT